MDDQFPESGERLWPSDPGKVAVAQYWFDHGMLPDVRGERPNFASAIAMVSLPLLEHMLCRQPMEHVIETYKSHPLPERRAVFTALRTGERRIPAAAVEAALDLIVDGLVGVEKQLEESGGPYVLGAFSIVDITMMACFHRLEDVQLQGVFDHPALKHVREYWRRLQARPSYTSAVIDWHDHANWRTAIVEVFGDAPSPHLGAVVDKLDARLGKDKASAQGGAA
ncbi:MAG: hypothetical protein AAGC77_12720 [Pseudomonadota bacterium]